MVATIDVTGATMPMTELDVLAQIDRRMLYDFIWNVPAEILAERMHVTKDSIWKSCANRGVPIPDEGHWMKVAAGLRPERPPLTDHRPGPQGATGTAEDAIDARKTEEEDPVEAIDSLLGEGTTSLIVTTAKSIVIDPDAKLKPHLRWQRDACRSERTLRRWLSENELTYRCLWWDASPTSVARMCSILEAIGKAAEKLGGSYDENGFDLFGERAHVSFSEHRGKYRKGQIPSRTYNGLLTMYVGTTVYKDYRKKTLEQDVPMAFVILCLNAVQAARSRQAALDAIVGTRARFASKQASIAAENERRKEFNREADRYERALGLAAAHDRTESLRRYAEALEKAGERDEAAWVRGKADWADPATRASDVIFGDERTPDGSAPERKRQIPYDTRGIEANAFFTEPVGDPSHTLEAFRSILLGKDLSR